MVDRFLFELTDTTVDAKQRSFKLLNALASLTQETLQLIGWEG